MEPVKIQINSLAALNRLIGEDSEFEFELRRSVVSNFFNKSNPFIVKLTEQLETELTNKIFIDKSKNSWRTDYKLKDEYISVIKDTVNEAIDNKVWPLIRELVDVAGIQKRIDEVIKAQVDYIINVWTSGQIEAAIDAGVRNVLKQQFELIQKVKG
jgi:hypothetical protein